jgi:hypothetical protein
MDGLGSSVYMKRKSRFSKEFSVGGAHSRKKRPDNHFSGGATDSLQVRGQIPRTRLLRNEASRGRISHYHAKRCLAIASSA